MSTTLERQSFSMSRELEYFTERELSMQLGEGKAGWPIMLVKELVDNALDACESKGIPPEIQVTVEPDAFTVSDNGPGLPVSVLRDSLNYQVRISDKAHYVSPSRGQLGNALKCVWAGPFVARSAISSPLSASLMTVPIGTRRMMSSAPLPYCSARRPFSPPLARWMRAKR